MRGREKRSCFCRAAHPSLPYLCAYSVRLPRRRNTSVRLGKTVCSIERWFVTRNSVYSAVSHDSVNLFLCIVCGSSFSKTSKDSDPHSSWPGKIATTLPPPPHLLHAFQPLLENPKSQRHVLACVRVFS